MSLAVVLTRPKEPLQLLDRELPPPGPGEVTVRIEACGLGLADWHVAMLDALPFTPLTLGCEAVGRREDNGARVGITPLATSCGTCPQCAGGTPYRCPAASWHGLSRDGALCERGNFAAQHLVPLHDEGDAAELAALMGSGLAAYAAVHAVRHHPRVGVFGLGGVGHLVAQLLGDRAHGFDPDAARLALTPHREPAGPLDAIIVCVPSAQAIQRAFGMLGPGGLLVIAADSPTGRLDLSLHALTARGISVVGTHLAEAGKIDLLRKVLKPRVTRKPLREAPELLYALRDGGFVGRLVFTP